MARSASMTPASGWNMTGAVPNAVPGHRSAAAAAGQSSAGTPDALRISCIFSCWRAGPKSRPPVVATSSSPASSASCRQSRCAWPVSRT